MEKEVRIAAAQAMAGMFAKAQMQIFGDPSTMAAMSQQFMRAASLGNAADGLLRTLPPGGQDLLAKVMGGVASSLTPGGVDGSHAVETTNGHATTIPAEVKPIADVQMDIKPKRT
jgi:hypothetical protein